MTCGRYWVVAQAPLGVGMGGPPTLADTVNITSELFYKDLERLEVKQDGLAGGGYLTNTLLKRRLALPRPGVYK